MIKVGLERILVEGSVKIDEAPTEVTSQTPIADSLHIYVKDKAGVSTPYWRDDAGTEHEFAGTSVAAPIDTDYLVKTANGTLTAERVVTDNTSITADWSVAGQVKFQREALTGDVTAVQNSNATTIANNAVTNAKLNDMAAWTVKVRNASSTGDPSDADLADFTTDTPATGDYVVGFKSSGELRKFDAGNLGSSGGGHLHGLMRLLGDGSTTTFNLLDIAEYLEHIADNGSVVDPATFSLSSDHSQITFDAAPTAGHVLALEYVIANI